MAFLTGIDPSVSDSLSAGETIVGATGQPFGLDQTGNGGSLDPGINLGGPVARSWRDLGAGRADPLLQFDWDVLITPPTTLGAPIRAVPAEYVEEIHVPMAKFDSESVVYQARKYYYAKFEEFGVASIKFYEDNRMTSTRFLRAWQQQIKDNIGNYRPPLAYKGTISVWPRDAKQINIARIDLIGVFPTQIPNLDFLSAGSRMMLEVEFSVDRVAIQFI